MLLGHQRKNHNPPQDKSDPIADRFYMHMHLFIASKAPVPCSETLTSLAINHFQYLLPKLDEAKRMYFKCLDDRHKRSETAMWKCSELMNVCVCVSGFTSITFCRPCGLLVKCQLCYSSRGRHREADRDRERRKEVERVEQLRRTEDKRRTQKRV